jgi:hypothetical protein
MIKFLLYCCVLLLLGGAVYFALSTKKEIELEKGTIDQITDKAAQDLVDSIRVPIEKARTLQQQEKDRVREADEAVKKMLE